MTTSDTLGFSHRTALAADKFRYLLIALIAFLTLVDLFATQAILPSLVRKFDVAPSTMGIAVNASTLGMALSGLAIALYGRNLDRRNGIWISLAALAFPTTLLAFTGNIYVFAALRILQGVFMAAAFTLTMAYVAEHFTAGRAAAALSAYVTGNVASNVFGRMLSATVADEFGIAFNFFTFAALNLLGAALVFMTLMKKADMLCPGQMPMPMPRSFAAVFRNPELVSSFAIGFFILFAFIGTFTYVNFHLTGGAIALSQMSLGLVYLVFLPSLLTTPLASTIAGRTGPKSGIVSTLGLAGAGLILCLFTQLVVVLAGLTLIAVGTFLAQAMATGHVSKVAGEDRAAASGVYLSSYYAGGLAGSFAVGKVYDNFGWSACVIVLGSVLVFGMLAARRLKPARGTRP